ncbi:MAG: patatin family protein [Lachnospiraceae bacterium]|nr:patatin family protein [Lachnospiraceae bacterium]
MKTGLIDVGGGFRGIYGAGVMDQFVEEKISFDYAIGVSAGSANIISFLAGQKERNYKFYMEYSGRWQYMSLRSLIKCGSYLNLEYVYGEELSNSGGEYPLDFEHALGTDTEMEIVTTDAGTGKVKYYEKQDMARDDYGAIKASSCLPLASKPYFWKGAYHFDGGLSDPIPIERALEKGCDRVVLILTRPKTQTRVPQKDERVAKLIHRKYPSIAEALRNRAETYNRELSLALEMERSGRLLILAPDDISGLKTLKRDTEALQALYDKGKKAAEQAIQWMEGNYS